MNYFDETVTVEHHGGDNVNNIVGLSEVQFKTI